MSSSLMGDVLPLSPNTGLQSPTVQTLRRSPRTSKKYNHLLLFTYLLDSEYVRAQQRISEPQFCIPLMILRIAFILMLRVLGNVAWRRPSLPPCQTTTNSLLFGGIAHLVVSFIVKLIFWSSSQSYAQR